MKTIYILLSSLFVTSFSLYGQQLYINEIMASNSHSVADGTGSYEDWVEIYNPNAMAVDIGGYYITDNLSSPTKYRLPTGSAQTVIPANGYLILWASEVLTRGANHINFKLSAGGEAVGLFRPNGGSVETVDQVTFGAQRTDVSWGRKPDGSATWLFFAGSNVSPGASNNSKTGFPSALSAPTFSQTGGFYASNFNLSITSTDPSATIYYTLDGSDPDPANLGGTTFQYKNSYPEQPGQGYGSLIPETYRTYSYTAVIPISDRTNEQNKVSLKSSTYNNTPNYFPTSPVFKGTVVRAVAYKANALISDIVTQTYFITPTNPARYVIPVVSIATNEKSFFEYNTGIYTAGIGFDNWRAANGSTPAGFCTPGNYSNTGDDWERPGNVEFFLNNSSIINQPAGLRINGNCSRYIPRKSLRLYGNTDFEYPFFANRPSNQFYNRLLLRSGGNDWNYSIIVDSYMQTMVRHLRFDTQSNRASAVFINGEYWGVHALEERYDKYYLNRNYNVNPDSVDVVTVNQGNNEIDEGDLQTYNSLLAYLNANGNFTQANYDQVRNTWVDIENFTDYQISEIYAANTDWPQNNQQLWRKKTTQNQPNAPYGHDGRFRWMMKDMDFGLSCINNYNNPTIYHALADNQYTLLFTRLMKVSSYKSYFINRYADLLNTTFNPTRTMALLTTFLQDYQPYMPEHFERWKGGISYNDWLNNVNNIRTFVQLRPGESRNHARDLFGLPGFSNVTVNVSNTDQGYVKVNTIDILPTTVGVPANPYPWTGTYFKNNDIRIVAKAKVGYRFVSWQEGGSPVSTDTAYSYNPLSDRTLVAVFDVDPNFLAKPAPYDLSSCTYRFDNWVASAPAATYPANMYFVSMNQTDPPLAATFALADTIKGAYNFSSSTRINGLGADGFSFINTGGANPGYVATQLGGAVLALKTTGLTEASVQWTGGTVTPNPRQYAIRLRYRVGNSGPFQDLLNSSNQPVEYVRNAAAGHSQVIGPVALPASLLNKPYVQLLWQYYWTGVGTSGARDQLRIDDIIVSRGKCQSLASGNWNSASTWSCGRVPGLCDDVVIKAGHQISLSINSAVARSLQLESAAKLLYASTTASLRIQNQ
ncbi:CotH kinase family protein [Spirosoma sp. KNUC1025]|uniref:CotH kinase family protein n=1 Tax=Spirosoma sp. KNUC1025 TaxID=2894082 RepID=UPI00386EC5F7|nr:CotH kinase family protein [Spirosoma sp. KNUC1025]